MARRKANITTENTAATAATSATRRLRKAAAFSARGRNVMLPPVSREDAEKEFGAAISEDAWLKICVAFDLYGERLADLDVTRLNDNKNDKFGWKRRKSDAESGIEKALSGLQKIDRGFLAEAAQNVSNKRCNERPITHVERHLDQAIKDVMYFSWIMREVEPLERDIMTDAESRKALAGDVFAALEGLGANLSNGWSLTQIADLKSVEEQTLELADLSGFERLVELLKIHQGETPMATAKWVREALAHTR